METIEAGRELDARVAEKVFGKELIKSAFHADLWFFREGGAHIPCYSTDIAAAWEVLQAMHRRGLPWVIEQDSEATFPTVHVVNPTEAERASGHVHFIEEMEHLSQTAESPAHAICLAALRAVGG